MKSAGVDLHDGDKNVDLQNTDGGVVSRRESIHGVPDANVGYTTDNTSRGYHHLLTPSRSDFFVNWTQICKLGTNPITGRTHMLTKPSQRTRKHRSPKRIRIGESHCGNQSHTMEHRTHELMASLARKFSTIIHSVTSLFSHVQWLPSCEPSRAEVC